MPSTPIISRAASTVRNRGSYIGPLLMLASALIFAVLDGLIKVMGPTFRVWDIAFLRWGGSLALLIIIFGRQGKLSVFLFTGCGGQFPDVHRPSDHSPIRTGVVDGSRNCLHCRFRPAVDEPGV